MRPLRLTMKAFGPYANEQTLDFANLKNRNFFLIHGPTGAGKTTILDAMCFALYGDTSGAERLGKQMRSDHAEQSKQTEVTFDFALGKSTYRVTRSPEQERMARRGNASVTTKGSATLWRLNDGNGKGDVVIATKASDVTLRIVELLGFRSDQFRQVVLLPQGKFRQLIMATSKERESILEALFKTEIYRRIEEALANKASGVSNEIDGLKNRKSIILEQASFTCTEELEQNHQSLTSELGNVGRLIVDCRQKELEAQTKLVQAQADLRKIDEAEKAQSVVVTLNEQKESILVKKAELAQARKAQGLVAVETALKNRGNELEEEKQKLSHAEQNLITAQTKSQESDRLLAIETAKQSERDESAKQLILLTELSPKVKELESARQDLLKAAKEQQRIQEEQDKAKDKQNEYQKRREAAQKQIAQLEVSAGKLDVLSLSLKHLDQAYEDRKRTLELAKDHKFADQAAEEVAVCLGSVEKHIEGARQELSLMEGRFANSQVAVLSRNLIVGEACPVCGSKEHPHPANIDGELPTEKLLNAKREEIQVLERSIAELSKQDKAHQSAIARLSGEMDSLIQRLGDLYAVDLADLNKRVAGERTLCAVAAESQAQLVPLKETLAKLESGEEKLKDLLANFDNQLKVATAASERAKAVVFEREQQIPQTLATQSLIEQSLKVAQDLYNRLKDSFEKAQQFSKRDAEMLVAATTIRNKTKETYQLIGERLDKQKMDFAKALQEVGFGNESMYQSARRSDNHISALEEETNKFDSDLSSAEDRLKRAREAAQSVKRANLQEIEEFYNAAKLQIEEAVRREASLKEKCDQIKLWLVDLVRTQNEIEALESRYGIVGRLADIASGRNAFKVTFQRFVLGALLDDVLIASSQRLRIMSKGRYHMQRMTERTDMRKTGGLDLEIYDSYTGTNRPVATLSGGESFIASLSMALGLADVVQSYSGGVYLETIFIDEGFGSLDPESLDLALRALIDLQQGGRLVGIISHVPELKERIDARLEVMPGRGGSSARFVVA